MAGPRNCEGESDAGSGLGIVNTVDGGELAWLGITRRGARSTIMWPQRCLTLDQIDRHPVLKVMGKRADEALRRRT